MCPPLAVMSRRGVPGGVRGAVGRGFFLSLAFRCGPVPGLARGDGDRRMSHSTERLMPTSPVLDRLLQDVKARLESEGSFGMVEVRDGMLVATAEGAADAAFYRLEPEGRGDGVDGLWVSLVTPSRWLSESIESDLVEHGDDVGELVEDELIELGYEGEGMPPSFQHFRSADMLYTFRTPLPIDGAGIRTGRAGGMEAAAVAALWMRAYEQAFRRLGDMEEKPEG